MYTCMCIVNLFPSGARVIPIQLSCAFILKNSTHNFSQLLSFQQVCVFRRKQLTLFPQLALWPLGVVTWWAINHMRMWSPCNKHWCAKWGEVHYSVYISCGSCCLCLLTLAACVWLVGTCQYTYFYLYCMCAVAVSDRGCTCSPGETGIN